MGQILKSLISTFPKSVFLQMTGHCTYRKRGQEREEERKMKRERERERFSSIPIASATRVVSVTILISAVYRSCRYSAVPRLLADRNCDSTFNRCLSRSGDAASHSPLFDDNSERQATGSSHGVHYVKSRTRAHVETSGRT